MEEGNENRRSISPSPKQKTVLPVWAIVVRNLAGFFYGAVMWSSIGAIDFETSPILSSIKASMWGFLGVLAVDMAATIGIVRPLSDVVVTLAVSYALFQKFNKN